MIKISGEWEPIFTELSWRISGFLVSVHFKRSSGEE
jgi:hypothetical protein